MNKKITVELSEAVILRAQARAKEEGYETLDAYVDALIREDEKISVTRAWLRERLEEGIKSGNAGTLTRKKLHRLVSEGIARAKRGA